MMSYQTLWKLACQYEKDSMVISLLFNTQIFFNLVLDYFFLGEKITIYKIVGALLIILTSAFIMKN